jgi:hypothetical protein
MSTNRRIAIIVGALFILATVASSLGIFIISSILDAPDYLIGVSANKSQVIMAALFMLIYVVAAVGIGIMMYPILRKHNETLALGYVAARTAEGVFFTIYVVILLLLLTLSQEFIKAGTPDASYFQTGGTLLLEASDWALLLGLRLAFGLSALILNYLLFISKLVPRWISGWGFAGAILVFSLLPPKFFSVNLTEILDLPIALQEMVFALWLIIKGFSSPAIVYDPAK